MHASLSRVAAEIQDPCVSLLLPRFSDKDETTRNLNENSKHASDAQVSREITSSVYFHSFIRKVYKILQTLRKRFKIAKILSGFGFGQYDIRCLFLQLPDTTHSTILLYFATPVVMHVAPDAKDT